MEGFQSTLRLVSDLDLSLSSFGFGCKSKLFVVSSLTLRASRFRV